MLMDQRSSKRSGSHHSCKRVVACPNDVKSYSVADHQQEQLFITGHLDGSATPITSGQGTTKRTGNLPAGICIRPALCNSSSCMRRIINQSCKMYEHQQNSANANVPTGAATVCPGCNRSILFHTGSCRSNRI